MTEVVVVTGYDALAEVYEWLISDAKLTPAEFAAAFAVVIDQEDLGFTPHALATSLVISTPAGVLDIIPTE